MSDILRGLSDKVQKETSFLLEGKLTDKQRPAKLISKPTSLYGAGEYRIFNYGTSKSQETLKAEFEESRYFTKHEKKILEARAFDLLTYEIHRLSKLDIDLKDKMALFNDYRENVVLLNKNKLTPEGIDQLRNPGIDSYVYVQYINWEWEQRKIDLDACKEL